MASRSNGSGGSQPGPAPPASSCAAPLPGDPGDRAQLHRLPGLCRVQLECLGFWPDNRGQVGIAPHHVHEVTHDCVANGTKLPRYGHVDVVEIPEEALSEVRRVNMERAQSSLLMPKCVPEKIKYVTASKTHFVHAQKLLSDGGRFLYNQGKVPLRWKHDDKEGALIGAQGPL